MEDKNTARSVDSELQITISFQAE